MNNFILLYGEVLDYPQQASIDKKGTEYYKFNLAVQRESGIIDILPIVVEEDTAAYNALADIDEKGEVVGAQLLITGEIRTKRLYPVYHVERHSHQGNGKTACRGLYRSRRALTEPRIYKRLRGQGKRA